MRWHKTALNEVAKVSSGDGAPQESSAYGYSGIPFVRAGSLVSLLNGKTEDELEKISDIEAKNRKMRKFPSRTVVFAKSGMSCMKGLIYELNRSCYVVNHLAAIECSNVLESRFLLRWFELNPPDRLIANASYPSIKLSDIRSIKIPLPPLSEQKRIAGILDSADALRTKRRKSLVLLDNLIQSTFLDMFGDPVTNPMEWGKNSLEDSCEKVIDCPHSTPAWSDSGVICLRTSNLGKGEWIWTDTRFVSEEDYKKRTKRSEIKAGDIILSREGTVGVLAVVQEGMRVCLGQRLVQLRVIETLLNPKFLLHLLLHDLSPNRLNRLMAGSTSKHLNVKELRKLKILVPPISLQHHFAAIVESIEKQKARLQAHLAELDTLFASLQQRAFNGEL